MIIVGRRSALLLLIGDAVTFVVALYATLFVRYAAPPGLSILAPFLLPFGVLFALWLLIYFSAGLYGKRLALFPSRVPDVLLRVQVVNIALAAIFFFLIPVFGIAPKTILAIYLVVSLALIYLWRLVLYPKLSMPRAREPVAIIGAPSSAKATEGTAGHQEAAELIREVNSNPRYGIEIIGELTEAEVGQAVHYQAVPFEDLYEEVFDRVPLSKLEHVWFAENVAVADPAYYVVVKRLSDIVGGVLMALVTIALIPIVWVANRIEGRGALFIKQERFGRRGAPISVYKFRSMTKNLTASGEWVREGDNRVTTVGAFLRSTSLDEFPQFVNILKGEMSLVGPRSDILGLGKRLEKELPYYEARYLVTPGITGWAQINQQYEPGNLSPQSVAETRMRLAYDFYYLKHRSLGLDLVIALKTVKRMFFRLSSA